MNFLLFQLQRLLMLPVRLITSPFEVFSALSDGSERSDALVKGLPAALVAILGTTAVSFMMWGGQASMVEFYTSALQKSENQRKILQSELQQEIASQNALAGGLSSGDVERENGVEQRRNEIKRLDAETRIYLSKLIKIQPNQREHKYRLASHELAAGNRQRCDEILSQIAPLDAPGYSPAHLDLARRLESSQARTAIQRFAYIDTALVHVEHCLTNDINNLEALKVKARLLNLKGSKKDAEMTFKRVFDADPKYFLPLIRLQSNVADRQATLLTASSAFSQQLTSSEVQQDPARWVEAWSGYAQSMIYLAEFVNLEQRLLRELERYKDNAENIARLPFLKDYLAKTYVARANAENGDILRNELTKISEANQKGVLGYFAKAYSYNENNSTVLQGVARLAFSQYPSVANQARAIYDPESQENLPPEVLNQMGLHALKEKNYKAAQQHYERARAASPNSPAILNNLAYAYLKSEDEGDFSQSELVRRKKSNAERAHDLVTQAMRLLPEVQRKSPNMSRYRHTLGESLMQLKNYAAAAAEFEMALAIRPEDVELLESVIICYDNFNLDSTPYREKLARVLAKQKNQP